MTAGNGQLIKSKRDHKLLRQLIAGGAATAGEVAGTGVAMTLAPAVQKLVFAFSDVAIALVDNAGTIAYGSLKFWDAPEGAVKILGSVLDLVITKSSAGVDADAAGFVGVGTVAANNTATLTTTEQNIVAATATLMASGSASPKVVTTAAVDIDGTATAMDAFLNLLVADADHDVTTTPCNLIINGTITLDVIILGDK